MTSNDPPEFLPGPDLGPQQEPVTSQESAQPEGEAHPHLPFPVVGIGASAGGLEAISHLLEHLPKDAGLSLLVAVHLEPHHLRKKVYQLLSMACRGRQHREEVQREGLDELYNGRAGWAVQLLQKRRAEMKNEAALDELINYIEVRKGYMPDYAARQQAGLWLASTRVEKFNDWAVSERCKHRGMAWTQQGVLALSVLEAARRNGELDARRLKGELPAWESPPLTKAA